MAEQKSEVAARAYLEYFWDLGVYDFYRRGQPATIHTSQSAILAEVAIAPPSVERLPVEPTTVQAGHPRSAAQQAATQETSVPPVISIQDRWPAAPASAADRTLGLQSIRAEIGDCTRCPLAYAGRHSIVFGDGDPEAHLMFVGEGPGADEDASGMPFVGKAGQLLNNMIVAMGLTREQVYVANIVKCRPPANRVPEPLEANTCTQFLARQIDVVRPEVIVALGATSAMYLLGVRQSLASLRGVWHHSRGAKVAVTYHPAFLLRDPRQKGEAWKDLQRVMLELGLAGPKR